MMRLTPKLWQARVESRLRPVSWRAATERGPSKFYVNATYRANTGELSGEVPLTGEAANYIDTELDCTLSFKFGPGSLVLNQDGACGMGLNVSAAGTYKRISSTPPKFDE